MAKALNSFTMESPQYVLVPTQQSKVRRSLRAAQTSELTPTMRTVKAVARRVATALLSDN